MATVMRLKRIGAKKAPVYRLIITDRRNRRDGRAIEEVGLYDPTKEHAVADLNEERVKYWLGAGAIMTDTVRGLLKKSGVLGQ